MLITEQDVTSGVEASFESISQLLYDLSLNLLAFFETHESREDVDGDAAIWLEYQVALQKLEEKVYVLVESESERNHRVCRPFCLMSIHLHWYFHKLKGQ
jgi:hypothetical protein